MRCVYSATHLDHAPEHEVQHGESVPAYESPVRIETIRKALEDDGSFDLLAPTDHGIDAIVEVHDERMVRFLERAWSAWEAEKPGLDPLADTVLHARLREGMEATPEPGGISAALGYWSFDSSTPLSSGFYGAARAAVDVALTTTDLVLDGAPVAYGLCRPPGHHAARAMFGGYCFFNNAAIAAEYLVARSGERVAILDVDYHHGNGTQQIFYRRADVFFASLHGDPNFAYPYFTGFVEETGAGAGLGSTLNRALPPGCDMDRYGAALDDALDALAAFRPSVVVVSLGHDTYFKDPIADFALTTEDMREMGRRVARIGVPLVILQEGGYHVADLGTNAVEWLLGASKGSA
jgi:acetoin utilization deacetylase AcuC-like enzyme